MCSCWQFEPFELLRARMIMRHEALKPGCAWTYPGRGLWLRQVASAQAPSNHGCVSSSHTLSCTLDASSGINLLVNIYSQVDTACTIPIHVPSRDRSMRQHLKSPAITVVCSHELLRNRPCEPSRSCISATSHVLRHGCTVVTV